MFKGPLPPRTYKDAAEQVEEGTSGVSTFRRINNRNNNEIRDAFVKLGENDGADGHCFYSLGNTKVLSIIYGPKPEIRGSYSEIGRVRLDILSLKQKQYEGLHEQKDKEMEGLLIEVVNRIILLERYKGCCIQIRCIIIRSDGGELAATLTSISLALLKVGIQTRDIICAISVNSLTCLKRKKTYYIVDPDENELQYYKDKYELNTITLGICLNSRTVCYFNGYCSFTCSKMLAEVLNFAEGACRALGDMLKKILETHMEKKYFLNSDLQKLKGRTYEEKKNRDHYDE